MGIIKVLSVVGARPQFIKAAALSQAFSQSDGIDEIIVHSGQHYDHNLSESFFQELSIPKPKYNLEIGSKSHNEFIGHFLIRFDAILEIEKPNLVLVYGDTNTTVAAAIAAAKRNIKLAHVEAGLREFDKSIPEEINKIITDRVTDLYFTPTETGKLNLKKEGVVEQVWVTGDISLDLLFNNPDKYISRNKLIKYFDLQSSFALLTCHRDNNTRSRKNLEEILEGVNNCGIQTIFPMHPRTKATIEKLDIDLNGYTNLKVLEPLSFWMTQSLIKEARFVFTDSGGIIKESYFHKTPSIIIDKQTEWLEVVDEGWTVITGPDKNLIKSTFETYMKPNYHSMALGDGKAGDRITKTIIDYFYPN